MKMKSSLVCLAVLLGGALMLAGCSTGPAAGALHGLNAGASRPKTAYGDYLAGRYASAMRDVDAAAEFYAAAYKKQPHDTQLRQRAFESALVAGRIKKAVIYAKTALGEGKADRLMRMTLAVDALRKGQYKSADLALAGGKFGPFDRIIALQLEAWAKYGQHDNAAALALLDSAPVAMSFSSGLALTQGMIRELLGQSDEAGIAYARATLGKGASDRAIAIFGTFLQRRGDAQKARAFYEKRVKQFSFSPMAQTLLKRMDAGSGPLDLVKNVRQGATESLFAAANTLAAQGQFNATQIYLQLAHFLTPGNDAVTEFLAGLLEVQERHEEALALYDSIGPQSPYRVLALLDKAKLLDKMKRKTEALDIYRQLASTYPDNVQLKKSYAAALQSAKKYDEALPLYNALIAAGGEGADWRSYFFRGVVRERLGDWRASVDDMREAIKLSPNRPDVLNYLGYSYINAGENLEEGLALIKQALKLRPNAGFIIDSLGWAYYRMGEYEKAVEFLEQAVEREPGEPTISDHLADAYWRVGRHLEARFQWRHTLTLQEDEDIDFAKVREKLDHGLPDQPELASAHP